ncbi:MAG: DUF624 domain-containing protein [Actinomycetaceae bacterium]|nr:DUF624 domain-containing protein [Actinomycetaceae bacterium]
MAQGLGPDSSFYRALTAATDLVVINLLTLLGCLPIVTAGASLTACARVTMDMARDEDGLIARSWWRSFRRNLIQSLGWWLPIAILLFLLWLENRLLSGIASPGASGALTGLLIAGVVFLVALLIWLIPLVAFFENTVIGHVGNAALLAVGHLGRTILALGLLAAPAILAFYVSAARAPLAWFMILLGVAFIAYLIALVELPVMNRLRDAARGE